MFFAFTGAIFSLLITWLRNSIRAEQESAEAFRLLVEGVKDYAIFMSRPAGSRGQLDPSRRAGHGVYER